MLSSDPGRLVVNFHIGFNIAVALIFLPLTGLVAKLTERVLPDPAKPADVAKPRHLEANVIDAPSEALACAMRETLNLGGHVENMLRDALVVFEKSDARLMKEVERTDNIVDSLHEAIKLYLVKVSTGELTEEESRRYVEILTFNTNLEHIGDIIDKNLMELAAKMIKNRYTFSDEGLERSAQTARPRHGQYAARIQCIRDARCRARATAAGGEGGDAQCRSRRGRQPLCAAARGAARIDRDQRHSSRRHSRPQAHQRPSDRGRLSDP